MVTRQTKKQILVEVLAHFLVDDQSEMTASEIAREWAKLRGASTLKGNAKFDEAVKTLTELLA